MSLPTVSVVVVSWRRPDALRRCLTSLQQQDHPALELCLVTDDPTAVPIPEGCRVAQNPAPNISAARNIGLAMARGEIVAFIDDDAVAEPTWAERLAAAFADPRVVAATGFTRGRNGLSFQWRAVETDATGADHPLVVPPGLSLHPGTPLRSVKPVGANCAFRRDTLLRVGGFDPAYRFYLDDADVALRLAPLGLTAIVPQAQVQHGFAASDRRRADRVPRDLHEIGASAMVFLRRHAPENDWARALERLRNDERRRMIGHMVDGRIEPSEVEPTLHTLEDGITDGARRALPALEPLSSAGNHGFMPLPGTGPRPGRVIAGRTWQHARLARAARAAVAGGALVTLFRFSPTALRHRHRFHPDGYWEQWGGLFGPADRSEPVFRLTLFRARLRQECRRWAELRPCEAGERIEAV
ncbi:MAG: glycosyltransferase family 2 protein [Gemmobacter sp.]|jgi:GT2 family glycosyltransferase|nr:glycosyltransferase family 2 protein [Gemmobacter sp.]